MSITWCHLHDCHVLSCIQQHSGSVAPTAEQGSPKPMVGGSNPSLPANFLTSGKCEHGKSVHGFCAQCLFVVCKKPTHNPFHGTYAEYAAANGPLRFDPALLVVPDEVVRAALTLRRWVESRKFTQDIEIQMCSIGLRTFLSVTDMMSSRHAVTTYTELK